MARRLDFKPEEILTAAQLKDLSQRLAHLSTSSVRDFYNRVYAECRITSRDFPPARALQELVQAWKQLRKWRR